MTRGRWSILAIFVLSGAAGLMYEVVWSRQLVLVFGNTTQAVSTILTGFFGGMAIGSVVGGRVADRVRSPLRLYGLIEIVLVVVVLVTPITFRLLHELYRGAYPALEGSPALLALLRFVLAVLALAPATVLMGATLPTLTRHLARGGGVLAGEFGRLYTANTIGAIVGTVAAGLILIELLGLTGTLVVAAACSGLAGIAALWLDRRSPAGSVTDAVPASPVVPEPAASPAVPSPAIRLGRPGLAHAVAFVSGLTSLGYQVLWTRLLSSGTGNSTYVFTIILATFLIGIAIGAAFFSILRPRLGRPINVLAIAQLVVAALVIVGLVAVIQHPVPLDPHRPLEAAVGVAGSIAVVVLPTTIVLGLIFPASSALLPDDEARIGAEAGGLLAANTLGAITATFAIPFLVIPRVGSPVALALLAVVNVVTAIVLAVIAGRARRATPGAGGGMGSALRGAIAVLGVAMVGAIVVIVSSPGILHDPTVARVRDAGGTILEEAEDEIAAVQAGQLNARQLWVTGTSMTLLTIDARLMPILPLIARPDAERALTVAFGMGSSYRTGLIAGLDVDGVELVPSVPKMFDQFYPDADAVLADPRGNLIIADGRNHLDLTTETYDIIVTDPPPPIESSGASVISSLEYYQAGLARLTPGGIMMQWMPYGSTLEEFKAHVRTFHAVFPNVVLAFGPGGYGFFMLGSTEPIELTEAAAREVLARPGLVEDLSSAYDARAHTLEEWVAAIPDLVWISGDEVTEFAGDGPLITDDRPLPEYFLLRRLFGPPSPRVTPSVLLGGTGQ